MNINNLPIDCLGHLFGQFALQELLQLRAICSTWKCIIEGRPFQIVKSLKIFPTYHAITHYNLTLTSTGSEEMPGLRLTAGSGLEDDLILGESQIMNSELLQLLKKLFPRVTKLVVHLDECTAEYFEAILELCSNWIDQLTSLTITGSPSNASYSERFCDLLNGLKSLKRLEILSSCVYENLLDSSLANETLARLECFAINGFNGHVAEILAQLTECIELRLDWIELTVEDLKQIIEVNPKILNNLTQLRLTFVELATIEYACKVFQHLEALDVDFVGPVGVVVEEGEVPMLKLTRIFHFFPRLNFATLKAIFQLPNLNSLSLTTTSIDFDSFQATSKTLTFPTLQNLAITPAGHFTSEQLYALMQDIFPALQKFTFKAIHSTMIVEMRKLKDKLPCLVQIRQLYSNEDATKLAGRHAGRLGAERREEERRKEEKIWAVM